MELGHILVMLVVSLGRPDTPIRSKLCPGRGKISHLSQVYNEFSFLLNAVIFRNDKNTRQLHSQEYYAKI